jgi:hypothetical protein
MKRLLIASTLALGLVAASFTALAADSAMTVESTASEVPGLESIRLVSHVDDTCHVWVNGNLRATIGPFGNSGILAVVPGASLVNQVLVRCDHGGTYMRSILTERTHCDLILDPGGAREPRIRIDRCL